MAEFREDNIVVFDNENLQVVQTDAETIAVEGNEVKIIVRDVRRKLVVDWGMYVIGVLNGAAVCALVAMLAHFF